MSSAKSVYDAHPEWNRCLWTNGTNLDPDNLMNGSIDENNLIQNSDSQHLNYVYLGNNLYPYDVHQ